MPATPAAPLVPIAGLHPALFAALPAATDRVLLCSPYLGAGVAHSLAGMAGRSPAEWSVLTVLDPVAAAYGSLSLDGLRALSAAGVALRHVDRLHAKVYLLDDTCGWAGSANLTGPGLGQTALPNRELSVPLDAHQRAAAGRTLRAWWDDGVKITPSLLDECEMKARSVPVRLAARPAGSSPARRRTTAAQGILDDAQAHQVWVKAIYRDAAQADEPWEEGGFVSSSKRGKPSFAVGDLLLIYARDAKICNAVLEVTDDAYQDFDEQIAAGAPADHAERWPWITKIRPRLQVPASDGVPLAELGLTGQSLQGGHCRMPTGGLAAALEQMLR